MNSLINKYAEGGPILEALPFKDDRVQMYHQELKKLEDRISTTGASQGIGDGRANVNYTTMTSGDKGRENAMHTLMANYGTDINDLLNVNAGVIKPLEAEGVYLGTLRGSIPVGEGRASLGVQGIHTKYGDDVSGYNAGYTGKVGDGNLSANYFEPKDHSSAGRQVQVQYNMPFAEGGSVTDKYASFKHNPLAFALGQGDEVRYADETSNNQYPNEGHNGRADALRHILWQAKLQHSYGDIPATLAGKAHEMFSMSQPEAESAMDLHNNEIGLRLGKENKTDVDILRKAIEAIDSGEAHVLHAEGGSVEYNPITVDQIIDATHKELGTGRYAEGGSVNKMQAIPQNESLAALAEALSKGRDIGNKVQLPYDLGGVGDLLVGKIPEEIENWSYGNTPMQVPEMSNLPQFKKGRGESFADALTTLAPGIKATEGLPAGLSFIGPKSRNWDKVATELAAKKLDDGPAMSISDNLNADLLQKYLTTGKRTPKEIAQYEANGLKMETPNLQKFNVANAMANPERNAHMASYDVYPYHGTNDVIIAPDYAFSGKGADQLGSAAMYLSEQPSLANGYVKPDISGGNVLPLRLRNTDKYMSNELENKLTPAQLREFITKSPDEDALWNFGDVGYEGKNKVINTAVQGYHQYGDEKLLDTLNTLNNDFYTSHPEEFNKLAGKLTKKAGVIMDTGENKIYAPWNASDIRSRFAAFDPLRKASPSLLAGTALGDLLLKYEDKAQDSEIPTYADGGSVEYNPIKIDQIIDATHKEFGTGRYADGGSVNTTLKLG